MADIFISYSAKDRERIKPLVEELKSRDWSVWWDRELRAGPAFVDTIAAELEQAHCVIVAWSEHSIGSHWCRDEAGVGLAKNRLVPCRIDDVQPPLGFRSSHTADLSGWPDREGELVEFLSAIADCLKVGLPIAVPARIGTGPDHSLLVLPFVNRSPDPDQDYFCDGLVEDITISLSHIPELMVLARSTSFEFKESKSSPVEIGRRLGAKAVLCGSVRRAGNRIRVAAQLLEVPSGKALWSQVFNRTLDDIFEVQDELTEEIVTALDVELVHGEQARTARYRHHSIEAAQEFYRGVYEVSKHEQSTMMSARQHFENFVELEPESPLGYAWLATCWAAQLQVGWASPQDALPKMQEHSAKALAIDPDNTMALTSNTYCSVMTGDLDGALSFGKRAVETGPNSDEAWFAKGWAEMFLGLTEHSTNSLEQSIRLAPIPSSPRLGVAATAYRNAERWDDSIAMWKQLISRYPAFLYGYTGLASTYAMMGRMDDAQDMIAEVLKRDPDFTVHRFTNPNFYRDTSVMDKVGKALREAGMPSGE